MIIIPVGEYKVWKVGIDVQSPQTKRKYKQYFPVMVKHTEQGYLGFSHSEFDNIDCPIQDSAEKAYNLTVETIAKDVALRIEKGTITMGEVTYRAIVPHKN